jgi:hypothetical protein
MYFSLFFSQLRSADWSQMWTSMSRIYSYDFLVNSCWNPINRQYELHSSNFELLFLMMWDWFHLSLRPLFGLLYQPQMINDDDTDCGAIGGMKIGRRNWSTRRTPAPVPLYPAQIPHDLSRFGTRAAAVGSRRLIAWAMAIYDTKSRNKTRHEMSAVLEVRAHLIWSRGLLEKRIMLS